MHEEVVRRVVLETKGLRDTGRVRDSGYTSITDKRIELVLWLEEEVEQLHKEYSATGSDDEGECTEPEDQHRVTREELRRLRRGTDRDAK